MSLGRVIVSKPAIFRSTLVCILAVAASGFGSDLDDRLNQRLKGGWATLEVEAYSACAGTYSDNHVGDAGVSGKAQYRFEAGELVKIDKVNAKRQRVDVLLTLAVPYRISRVDGPFELFDERRCQVQLIVPVPREEIKAGDDAAVVSRLEEVITLYLTLDDARDSDSWNGRETEALPSDYDQTLERYAVWQAEQTNAAVNDAIRRAVDDAADIAEDLSDDSDYLAGFAAGAEKMREFNTTDCASLLTASFALHDTKAPDEQEKRWRDGWEDGQELIFNVLLADRLQACRVPVPPAP